MAKSEHPFDQIINEKLDAFSSQDSPTWSFMQQKITDAESDLEFDQKIRQSLEDLKVDSRQIQWDSFVAKKNRQIARRNKIITARVIESCLMLLLLWTIDNIGITNIIKQPIQKQWKSNPIASLNSRDYLLENQLSENSNDLAGNAEDNSVIIQKKDEPNPKGFDRKKFNSTTRIDKSLLHKKLQKPPFIDPLANGSKTINNAFNNVSIQVENSTKESIESATGIDIQKVSTPESSDDVNKQEEEIITPLDRVLNDITFLESQANLDNQLPAIKQILKPVVIQKSVLLNIHSGLMANVILSPPLKDPNSDKLFSQLRPGFQTSLTIGFQSKKFMLESGLSYQLISYEPNVLEIFHLTNGIDSTHFSKIKTQILTIPVLIHINLVQHPLWSISTKAGLSLSAALQNEFTIDTSFTYFEKNYKSIAPVIQPESEIKSRIRNPLNYGILDGGDFGINSYANLVAGIRYTRKFSRNLAFYTEVEISKMLGTIGFGPNGDRFISTNLNTGLSFKL